MLKTFQIIRQHSFIQMFGEKGLNVWCNMSYMAELVSAEKELSDWFRERSEKDLTKSCFGKILEERTVLYKVETLFSLAFLPIISGKTSAKMTL